MWSSGSGSGAAVCHCRLAVSNTRCVVEWARPPMYPPSTWMLPPSSATPISLTAVGIAGPFFQTRFAAEGPEDGDSPAAADPPDPPDPADPDGRGDLSGLDPEQPTIRAAVSRTTSHHRRRRCTRAALRTRRQGPAERA